MVFSHFKWDHKTDDCILIEYQKNVFNRTHIPHFPHVVQKDTWIIITILSQQIKQINSIEHKKLVAWIFWANQGFLLAE